jgi:hypothetical protein
MKSQLLVGSFPGTTASANPCRWTESDLFVQFLTTSLSVSDPKKGTPVLLILDSQASQKSLKAISMCRDDAIHGHSTTLYQQKFTAIG